MNDINFLNVSMLSDSILQLLQSNNGDILCCDSQGENISVDRLRQILNYPIIDPIYRITVLNEDETVDYIIPNTDIVANGISYNENYSNGQRREVSLKLINVVEFKQVKIPWERLSPTQQSKWENSTMYYSSADYYNNFKKHMKYAPNVDNLWYGKKIKYDIGIRYMGQEYFFNKGIYVIDGFDFVYGVNQKDVTYKLKDKFVQHNGTMGTLDSGYEVPVGTPVEEVIESLQNLSCATGYINDTKPYILNNKFVGFKTQATIRVDMGGKIADIYDQLSTQMSAEYYYNSVGMLTFDVINESLNNIDKPILWTYGKMDLDIINLRSEDEIVNVVKVVGNNIDGAEIFTAVAKNTNLISPINIYYIKERLGEIIQNPNIWSQELAQDLADYELRKRSMISLRQTINVPFNPLLMVNNLIEINNDDLNIERKRFLINAISYTSDSATMSIEIVNIDELPIIGQVKH